jgi:hypothetical protein
MSGSVPHGGHNLFPPGTAIRIGQPPHRNEDCQPGLPADDTDLDLAVAGEAVFEGALWCWHSALLGIEWVRT